jgi:membrane fusion protein, heavy metal efflux system
MRTFLILLLSVLSWSASAHGGEEHGGVAAVPPSRDQGVVASASGSVFEVVLKSAAIQPGVDSTVRVLVSDFETNLPINGAIVDIELKDASQRLLAAKATETKTSGVYELTANFPKKGSYSFDLTIQAEKRADLLAVSGFVVGSPEEAVTITTNTLPLLIGGGVALFFVAFFFGFFIGRAKPSQEEDIS